MVQSNINSNSREYTLSALTVVSESKESNKAERVRLQLVNTDSTNTIRIGVDQEPTTGTGIPLFPGGSVSWVKDSSTIVQQKRVLAIPVSGSPTLAVYEEVIN